ncbi:MAG: hypothetical protein ACOCRK_04820, partial [bacterium]
MSLVHTLYDRFEDEIDDEFIVEGLELMKKRRQKMADWIHENTDYKTCPECESLDIDYKHHKVYCNQCGWEEEHDVPYP